MGKELTKKVFAAAVAAKDTLADVDETKHTVLVGKVNSKMANLNEVVVKKPEDIEGIERRLGELDEVR